MKPPATAASDLAIILAGGVGSRVSRLYPELPKPMIPVAGRPFLDWVLQHLAAQGIRSAVISACYKAEVIRSYYEAQLQGDIAVSVLTEAVALGTGAAVSFVRSRLQAEVYLVLNGDTLTLAPLGQFLHEFKASGAAAAICCGPVQDTGRYGSLHLDGDGYLCDFAEKREGSGLVNAGVYLFRPSVIDLFPQRAPLSMEHEVLPYLLARGVRLRGFVSNSPFLDIGTPETLTSAPAFVARHLLSTSCRSPRR
jgi:D-glycero-alpha-D-manno-heptose 1-phosphate guanylyltransferase